MGTVHKEGKCEHCGQRIVWVAYIWMKEGWYHQTQADFDKLGHDQGLRVFCRVNKAEPQLT